MESEREHGMALEKALEKKYLKESVEERGNETGLRFNPSVLYCQSQDVRLFRG